MAGGTGYAGSPVNSISASNQEIITNPTNWSKFSFYKFSFYNIEACSVKINNSNPISLMAGQGFTCDPNDMDSRIYSFIIIESGIHYNFLGAY